MSLGPGYDNWRLASPPEYDGCEDCPCGEAESPKQVWLDDVYWIKCHHPDVCGCDQCDCACHDIDDGSAAYEDMLDRAAWEADNYDYDGGR